jgi:hypothetical protein
MSDRTFHFAVKPGCDPVQLPNLSAHSKLPWVARGYEFSTFTGAFDIRGQGHVYFCMSIEGEHWDRFLLRMGRRHHRRIDIGIRKCVAKCVAKPPMPFCYKQVVVS